MCTGKSLILLGMRAAPGKFHKNLAKNLKRMRGELSQPVFAKKIGITHATVNRIEQQKQNVTISTLARISHAPRERCGLEKICKALKCSPNDLLSD
jgi:DNA-binding Xre family transcriptional regulator